MTFTSDIFILILVGDYEPDNKGGIEGKIMSNQPNTQNEEEIFDPQEMYVTLDLDDGSQLECQIVTIFEANDQNYIALAPTDNDEEIIFYRYFEDEEGNPSLENIENDDEFDMVIDRFDELLDEEEFEEM